MQKALIFDKPLNVLSLILTLLGTSLYFSRIEVSWQPETFRLLNFMHGIELSATWFNLVLTKIAVFLFLWG